MAFRAAPDVAWFRNATANKTEVDAWSIAAPIELSDSSVFSCG